MTIETSGHTLGLNGTCTGGTGARNQIGAELGDTAGTRLALNCTALRTLAGKSSGQIAYSDFYGKSNRASVSYTFSSNSSNATLNVSGIGGYVSGKSCITVKVNSGIYLYATSTSYYGLTLTGGASGDKVTLQNCGYIMGMGGYGAAQTGNCWNGASQSGGPAMTVSGISSGVSIYIINNSYIGGGGGGGGQGHGNNLCCCGTRTYGVGGGGAGGGAGGG